MKRKSSARAGRQGRTAKPANATYSDTGIREILWRLDRLERQVKTLSDLVRYHAEDADRLVKIVGEDHEVLRRELLQEHQETLKRRKRLPGEVRRMSTARSRLRT